MTADLNQHPSTFRITFGTADLLDRHLLDAHAVDAGSDDLETLERRAEEHAVHGERFPRSHRHEWPDGNVKPPLYAPTIPTIILASAARAIADLILSRIDREVGAHADDWLGQPSSAADRAILDRYVRAAVRREL